MNVDILMPKMGESITESRIIRWLKQPGDQIEKDESLLEIATDKVDTDVPSPAKGILVHIITQENETVDVGTVIGIIETDAGKAVVLETGTASAVDEKTTSREAPAAEESVAMHSVPPSGFSFAAAETKKFFSPVVQRIAAENGIGMQELSRLNGSGAGGRITKKDLFEHIEMRTRTPQPGGTVTQESRPAQSTPAVNRIAGADETIPMDNIQRLMAEHMVKSKQTSPHVTVVSEVDMTKIVQYRDAQSDAFKTHEGFSLTFMPFIADATVRALKDFPLMNSSVDGSNIIVKKAINLGIAVAMDDGGLIVPVVKHAEALNLTGLARSMADLAGRARKRKLRAEEIQDGTFTITNFGVFGNLFGTPVINQPQVGILGAGAIKKRPVVIEVNGESSIAIRSMMYLSLSFDHRIIDGALGGRFIERVAAYLEQFELSIV
jgi:2-oxoglutarate dehydrogenase E2 component (dihydrolipoamide succinyltransferase)